MVTQIIRSFQFSIELHCSLYFWLAIIFVSTIIGRIYIYIYINFYGVHSSFTSNARPVKTFQNICNKQVNQNSENQNFVHGFCSLRNAYSNPSHPPILNCIMNGVTFIGHDKSPSRSGPMVYSELNFDVSTIQPDTFL